MSNPNYQNAKKRLEQIQKSSLLFQKKEGIKEDVFFKPTEEKKVIKILPRSNWSTPFFETAYHYNIAGQKIYCPNKNEQEPCVICDFWKNLKINKKNPEASQIMSKWSYTAIVVEINKDGSYSDPKLWTFSSNKLYEKFIANLGDEDYSDYTSFDSKGWNWKVGKVPNNTPGAFTTHTIECLPFKQKALTDSMEEIEILKNKIIDLENFYTEKLLKRMTSVEVKDIYEKWSREELEVSSSEEISQEQMNKIVDEIKF